MNHVHYDLAAIERDYRKRMADQSAEARALATTDQARACIRAQEAGFEITLRTGLVIAELLNEGIDPGDIAFALGICLGQASFSVLDTFSGSPLAIMRFLGAMKNPSDTEGAMMTVKPVLGGHA